MVGRHSIIEPRPIPLSDEVLIGKLFRALGDPTRLRIIDLLIGRPLYQKEIVAEVGVSQGQVSQHLRCLTWCGFVKAEPDGRLVLYRVADPRVVSLVDLAHTFLEKNAGAIASCRIAT